MRKQLKTIFFFSFLFYSSFYAQRPQEALQQALALKKECAWEAAIEQFEVAYLHYADNISFLYKYAHTLKDGQCTQQAIKQYKNILALDPSVALAHLDLGFCYLSLGDFQNGWLELFWRSPQIKQFPRVTISNFDFSGKTVLIRAEWGMGDMIQFIRFADSLRQRGATVILQAYPALVKLLQSCTCIDAVFPVGEAFPEHDIQIPLMSLMEVAEASLENLPTAAYLQADPELVEFWEKKLEDAIFFAWFDPSSPLASPDRQAFNIGVCWSGRGGQEIHPKIRKNIPLKLLKTLSEIPGVKFYSLQKENDEDQLADKNWIETFGPDFDDTHGRFMDTAAVMKHLDLVLTVDTSIAHLAGALGVPVWIMLPYTADWRWMQNRNDSPWYPTARLFRQTEPGNWNSVVTQIEGALQEKLAKQNG